MRLQSPPADNDPSFLTHESPARSLPYIWAILPFTLSPEVIP
jgi:hypothetical protein